MMNFVVSARISARRFVYHHTSMLNALDQGMSLLVAGMADVRITDGSGLAWTPSDLYRHLFGDERVGVGRSLEEMAEGVSFAA